MSNYLYRVLDLENDLSELYFHNQDLQSDEGKKIISQMEKLLAKLNNFELIYLLKNGTIIHQVLDILVYFKKYKINKKELKENNSYKEELNNLNSFIEEINKSVWNEDEHM